MRKAEIPKNRGRLKNGNPPGDYLSAQRCGALTRKKTPCQQPRMRGKRRCRLHGGKSTGARTAAGIQRIRQASWKDGLQSPRLQRECRIANAKEAAMWGAMGWKYSVKGICVGPPSEWADDPDRNPS